MEDSHRLNEFYGTMKIEPTGEFIAGIYTTLTLTYTAGVYGMDDLGGLKILFRYACDQSPLQIDNPKGVGYTTALASNGANIELNYYLRESKRPWYKVLRVRIAGQGLKKGDSITIKLGDRSQGSLGIRLQTFVEPRFEFRTLVDVFSTNLFKPIKSPEISLVSGKPVRWKMVLPTLCCLEDQFALKIRAEDIWGNPSDKAEGRFLLKSSESVENLPEIINWNKGAAVHIVQSLSALKESEQLQIELYDSNNTLIAFSNPLVIKSNPEFLHYWGDLHGQSEETIGSNTIRMYFEFARDKAFLDVIGHQGNDFQVTQELWMAVNELSEEFTEPGCFIAIPGYEYSANTALGGDRNVYFLHAYRQIHRSSHALIPNTEDIDTDCLTASDLFEVLIRDTPDTDDTVVVFAHVGGRYSDILMHHNGRVETSIEIHSAWGTFEWLLHDAFQKGYRLGIVANSDDHKGRPGVAYPGSAKFGSYGGLTCFLAPELTREAIFKSLKQRRHYATTGERLYLEVYGILNVEGQLFNRDPALYSEKDIDITQIKRVQIGNIIKLPEIHDENLELLLKIRISADNPIERLEIFNGLNLLEMIKPYQEEDIKNSKKIRVQWEGAELKARRRNARWNGSLNIINNEIIEANPFSFWNLDAPLVQNSAKLLSWDTYTSGSVQGFDVLFKDCMKGEISFKSNQISFALTLAEITPRDTIFQAGGLGKQVKLFRVPEVNKINSIQLERTVILAPTKEKDDRIYVKITLENGHQAWTSPMYFFR
ncbi:MAG: DUF3604 domain-containing protein [Promethearchaeota archaeon]